MKNGPADRMPHDDKNRKLSFSDRLLLREAAVEKACSGLGRALISFQSLQHLLSEIAGFLLDPKDFTVGIVVTSEVSFRALLNLVYSLAQHRGMANERIGSLGDILKDCQTTEQRRNALIHSYWEPDPESLSVTRFKYTAKYPAGYRYQVEEVTEAELLEFSVEIRGLCLDLTELMDAHSSRWSEHTSWPEPQDVTSSLLPKNLRDVFPPG